MMKSVWHWMGIPIAAYCVFMLWLSGFQSGYDQGQNDAWKRARSAFMASTVAQADIEVNLNDQR